MGSETGAKWFVTILIYFVVMTFTVGLIGQLTATTIGSETALSGTYCDEPRDVYEPYSVNPLDQTDITFNWRNHYQAQIECGESAGVVGQSACETLDGCSWDAPSGLWAWISGADDTCIGELNYTFITSEGTHSTLYGEEIDTFLDINGDNSDIICEHPDILYNQTLCEAISCSYIAHSGAEDLKLDTPKLSVLGNLWKTAKDMVSFRFDFGFDDANLSYLVNFLVFYLPLLGLIISGYIMVRS